MEQPLDQIDLEILDDTTISPDADSEPILEVVVIEENEDGEVDDTSEMDEDIAASIVLQEAPFTFNIAQVMNPDKLQELGDSLHELVEADLDARSGWEEAITRGMPLLGITMDEITTPWDGACSAYSPIVLESVMRFQAEVMQETCPASGPAKVNLAGIEDKERIASAHRVTKCMNHMATVRIKEYAEEHEKLLFGMGLMGYGAKKFWVDVDTGRMHCKYVPAWDMIIPDCSGVLNDYPRFTQRIRMDSTQVENNLGQLYIEMHIEELDPTEGSENIASDKRDQLLGITPLDDDTAADYTFFELHVKTNIDIDPITEGRTAPYIITIQACTGKVLAIYRGWVEGDNYWERNPLFTDYRYNPAMGSYGLGLLQMLGSSAETATAGTRQLIDAGTLSNLPGGYKDSNLNIKGSSEAHIPGEWRDADVSIGKLSDAFFSLPYGEPSLVLAGLVDKVVTDARGLVGLNELRPADMSTQAPVGTTLALLERALKPLSAVQSRIHRYMRQELQVIRDVIIMFYDTLHEREPMLATIEDLKDHTVQPVSDSNASTLTQRIAQYQMVSQMAEKAPDKFNLDKLAEYGLNMIDFPGTDEVLKNTEEAKPMDPITENGHILVGESVKAFPYQDHESHMRAHQALRDDPLVTQLVGQSPQASAIMAAWDSHMREHAAMLYVAKAQAAFGAQIPADMTPEEEKELSQYLVQASQAILQENQATVAQQQAKQAAEDPVLKDQQQRTSIEQGELLLKAKKHDDDSILKLLEILSKTDLKEGDQLLALLQQLQSGLAAATPPAPTSQSLPTEVQQ